MFRYLLVLLVLSFFIACNEGKVESNTLASEVENGQRGKAVVFDAGSSGTRVFIYDWQRPGGVNDLPIITLPNGRTKKINPGIATLSDELDQVPQHLAPLIEFAKQIVGENDISTTPLFFAGTAGLRLLEQGRNPQGYREVMNRTKEVLANSGFFIAREPGAITGQEEGVYAWVNVNALENRLSGVLSGTDKGIGIVEMGGASFQMAFVPDSVPQAESYTIKLAEKNVVLYAHSYGDLGENEARTKFSDKEFCEWGGDLDGANAANLSGDFDKCKRAIENKILELLGSECSECGIGATFQPEIENLDQTFYALGSLGFLAGNFGINTVNAQALREKGLKVCNVPFEDAKKEIPALSSNFDLMQKQCFNLAYYSTMLAGSQKANQNGLGFPGDALTPISVSKINGQEVTWTYGLLLLSLDAFIAGLKR